MGWTTAVTKGTSIGRIQNGMGELIGFDDYSSYFAGWDLSMDPTQGQANAQLVKAQAR